MTTDVEAELDAMVATINPDVGRSDHYCMASVELKAQIVGRLVRGQREEIRQLRGGSAMTPDTLHKASDTIMEEIEATGNALIAEAKGKLERKVASERLSRFLKAWGTFLSMTSERAAFQMSTNMVREIRRRLIYTAVALDRWRQLDGVQIDSNAAGNDLSVILQALCEIGGQDDIRYCHRYVKDHGEEFNTAFKD